MSEWVGHPIIWVEDDLKMERRRKKVRKVYRSITYPVLFAFKDVCDIAVITEVDREIDMESEINGSISDTLAISIDGISVKDYSLQKFRGAFHNFYFFEDSIELWS